MASDKGRKRDFVTEAFFILLQMMKQFLRVKKVVSPVEHRRNKVRTSGGVKQRFNKCILAFEKRKGENRDHIKTQREFGLCRWTLAAILENNIMLYCEFNRLPDSFFRPQNDLKVQR